MNIGRVSRCTLFGLLLCNGVELKSAMRTVNTESVPDLSRDKTLYVVGYAHLDTQWLWTYKVTIDDYIKRTLDDNFALFEQYPDYNFNLPVQCAMKCLRNTIRRSMKNCGSISGKGDGLFPDLLLMKEMSMFLRQNLSSGRSY